MSTLREVIEEVRGKVLRYRAGAAIGEQDTKATLVEPVLRALGWDVEDADEVRREYKPRRRDKPRSIPREVAIAAWPGAVEPRLCPNPASALARPGICQLLQQRAIVNRS